MSGLQNKWIVWAVSTIHLIQGICLLIDWRSSNVTSLHFLVHQVFGGNVQVVGWLYMSVSLLVVFGILTHDRYPRLTWLAVAVQQGVLYLAAGGAAQAMINSAFADGEIRARAFLISDQITWSSWRCFTLWHWYGHKHNRCFISGGIGCHPANHGPDRILV